MRIIRYIKEMARIAHSMRGYTQALKDAKDNGIWICPRCNGWMTAPPKDYNICPHCKVEFGYDAPETAGLRIVFPGGFDADADKSELQKSGVDGGGVPPETL